MNDIYPHKLQSVKFYLWEGATILWRESSQEKYHIPNVTFINNKADILVWIFLNALSVGPKSELE